MVHRSPKCFDRFVKKKNKLLKKFTLMAEPCNLATYVTRIDNGRSWQIFNGHYLQSGNEAQSHSDILQS